MKDDYLEQMLSQPTRLLDNRELAPVQDFGPPPTTRVEFMDLGAMALEVRQRASQDAISPYLLLIVAVCGGLFGADRFLVGQTRNGLLKLVTLGGIGIWWAADIYRIVAGKDPAGKQQLTKPERFNRFGPIVAVATLFVLINLVAVSASIMVNVLKPEDNGLLASPASATISNEAPRTTLNVPEGHQIFGVLDASGETTITATGPDGQHTESTHEAGRGTLDPWQGLGAWNIAVECAEPCTVELAVEPQG